MSGGIKRKPKVTNGPTLSTAIEIVRPPDTVQRNARLEFFARVAAQEIAIEIGLDIARCERIDEDAVARQLHRQDMRQVDQPRLGRSIARQPGNRADTLREQRGS